MADISEQLLFTCMNYVQTFQVNSFLFLLLFHGRLSADYFLASFKQIDLKFRHSDLSIVRL